MIKLFSEKVSPTFTSSDHNILTVESFEEVFFDVFEFEINGTKYIAEKSADFQGSPVVSIPVVEGDLERNVPFVLVEGDKFEVLYNESASSAITGTPVVEAVEDDVIQSLQESLLVEVPSSFDTLEDRKQGILDEIASAKKLAEEYAERIKIQKIQEAHTSIEEKKQSVNNLVGEIRKDLIEEFNNTILNTRADLDSQSDERASEIENKLTSRIEDNFNLFFEKNNERVEEITTSLNEKVQSLVSDILEDRVNPALQDLAVSSKSLLEDLASNINLELSETEKRIRDNIDNDLQNNKDYVEEVKHIITDQHVVLNDKIKKGVDKALGRVGNIKNSLQRLEEELEKRVDSAAERIDSIEESIKDQLDYFDNNIRSYYDERISAVENNIENLTESQKEYFKSLIEKSKESLLDQIKESSTLSVIEEKYDPKSSTNAFAKDLKKIRKDLEQEVANKFTQEISSLKKLIELSAGGGGNGGQFDRGGTMKGNLTVVGTISARKYLGIDTVSGGSDVSGLSSNWESTYTTVEANSASWASDLNVVSEFQASSGAWQSTYTTVGANSAAWAAAGTGDFCSTTVLLNEVSACGGTMSVDGTLSASNVITTALTANTIHLNTDPGAPNAGTLSWNSGESTLDLTLDNDVTLQVGEEQVINVWSNEDILNGQVVYASGAVGAGSGRIQVSLYSASSAEGVGVGATDELFFLGVATQNISAGFEEDTTGGYITTFGKVRDVIVRQGGSINYNIVGSDNVDVSPSDPGWDQGTVLYVSTEAGKMTNTPPVSPNKVIPAAMVIGEQGTHRTLFVRYEHGYHIDELHDVRTTNPQDGDVLMYNAALSSWENVGPVSNIIDAYHQPQVLAINQPTITYDSSNGINAVVTLSADHTLDTITNAPSGTSGTLTLIQDSVGGHLLTVTPGNYYTMTGDLTATADMTANQVAKIAWDTHDGVNFYLWITYPVA